MNERHMQFKFTYPATIQPEWSNDVERWYQLDAAAYGLAEFYWQNKKNLKKPDLIILASPLASNETDRSFVQTGAHSPAKFIHTLPSVRVSSLCQVMNWSGPVLCLQKGPQTIDSAVFEARQWHRQGHSIWVLSVILDSNKYFVFADIFDAL